MWSKRWQHGMPLFTFPPLVVVKLGLVGRIELFSSVCREKELKLTGERSIGKRLQHKLTVWLNSVWKQTTMGQKE